MINEWRHQSPATAVLVDEKDKTDQYFMTRTDGSASSPAPFSLMPGAANFRLGTLRCVFPGAESAAGIERLLAVFGDQIHIEFR